MRKELLLFFTDNLLNLIFYAQRFQLLKLNFYFSLFEKNQNNLNIIFSIFLVTVQSFFYTKYFYVTTLFMILSIGISKVLKQILKIEKFTAILLASLFYILNFAIQNIGNIKYNILFYQPTIILYLFSAFLIIINKGGRDNRFK